MCVVCIFKISSKLIFLTSVCLFSQDSSFEAYEDVFYTTPLTQVKTDYVYTNLVSTPYKILEKKHLTSCVVTESCMFQSKETSYK
jgi:hypothetical protein